MGVESTSFNQLFDEWAASYDETVFSQHGEYYEVFEGYEEILNNIVKSLGKTSKRVVEFGPGTGNLTQKLVEAGHQVIAVEPSKEMREKFMLKGINAQLVEGSFLQLPFQEKVDAFVSSYAFHHLTLSEKGEAIRLMRNLLKADGMIVFADTAFATEEARLQIIERALAQGANHLVQDLQTEYYELLQDLQAIFEVEGFTFETRQLNRYVWLLQATRK